MWPYGINGANEDNNTQLLYRANAMLVEAFHEDGLNATRNYPHGTPCYSYIYNPTKKYYLMNKDAERGLGEGLLYQRSNSDVAWKPLLTGAVVEDNAAWYIEYDPKTGLYSFKNVSSDKYITHTSGGLIELKALQAAPGNTEKFQLMPDRTDVTFQLAEKTKKTHGYWFIWGESSFKSMSAASFSNRRGYGSIPQEAFDFSDKATKQQWIILSEDELAAYQQKAIETSISAVNTSDETIVGIYTMDGILLNALQQGFNIIKYSNGQVKKIFVE